MHRLQTNTQEYLQQYYSSVTAVLQQCYSSVTAVLQQCYSSVTAVLQRYYSSVIAVTAARRHAAEADLAHFLRVGVLCEASNDDLHQLLRSLGFLQQVCGGSTADRHHVRQKKGKKERTSDKCLRRLLGRAHATRCKEVKQSTKNIIHVWAHGQWVVYFMYSFLMAFLFVTGIL